MASDAAGGDRPLVSVATASSRSGCAAVRALLAGPLAGRCRVRGVFRSPDKAEALTAEFGGSLDYEALTGVDAATEDGIAPAFIGADYAVVVTPSSPGMSDDAQLTGNMIRAAKAAGVRHIVYVGSWTVNAPNKVQVLASRFVPSEKLLAEIAAEEGGPGFTSLRSGFFYQNYAAMWGGMVKGGTVKWPALHVPAVDPRDMGRVAAAILAGGDVAAHAGKHYEISGPRMLTTEETVGIVASKLGKKVAYQPVPASGLTFLPPFLQELLTYMEEAGQEAIPISDAVLKLCGSVTSFEEWLDEGNISAFKSSE